MHPKTIAESDRDPIIAVARTVGSPHSSPLNLQPSAFSVQLSTFNFQLATAPVIENELN
jgi:hypothetical protein